MTPQAGPPLLTRSTISELLARYRHLPRKTLGQNFVADPNTIRRIVTLAGITEESSVVEIGPGLGSLTLGLAMTAGRVVAVEADPSLLEPLAEVTAGTGVEVIGADALSLDWAEALSDAGAAPTATPKVTGWDLVANLPYSVATSLLLGVAERAPMITRGLVMVQREVGERWQAEPGSRTYGIPTVMLARWGTASIVGEVPRSVFVPEPRVDSVLVRFVRHERSPIPTDGVDDERLDRVVRTAFGGRRKMLRRSLSGVVSLDHFEAAGVDPTDRPEQLALADFSRLAAQLPVGR
jgi:16S rRNA (adenine1518-N6/adenine1519-N6)-dimethyltransferase